MPKIAIWSPADFGTTSFVFSGSYTMTGTVDQAEFSDDDPFFHDGPADTNVPPEEGDAQLLTSNLIIDGVTVGIVGQPIYNAAEATVTNNTTGEVGQLLYITVGDGGTGAGFVGYASSIFINPGDNFTISNVSVSSPTVVEPYDDVVPCFVKGTLILTPDGDRSIESLSEGDLVVTRDEGPKEIRWIGSSTVDATGDFAPIEITSGVIENEHGLIISPQHRILITGWQAELFFGVPEVLVAAKHLLFMDGVDKVITSSVEYFHILFDQHEIIYSMGVPSESFYPGPQALGSMSLEVQKELYAIFPELSVSRTFGSEARLSLKPHEAVVALNQSLE